MKRLAIIPTVFALVAMVAACADMTAPEVTPPQFGHGLGGMGQCPPGWVARFSTTPKDVNGDNQICVKVTGGVRGFIIDNRGSDVPELPTPPIPQ